MPAVTKPETRRSRGYATVSPRPHGTPWPPDLSDQNWSEQPCFSRYWQHYHSVMSWSRLQRCYHQQANDFYHRSHRVLAQSQQPTSMFHHQENFRSDQFDPPRQQFRGCQYEYEDEDSGDTDDCDDIDTDSEEDSEDFEMEITNEMLEFFTKSHQHRLERDAARASSDDNGDKKEQTRIDLATASVQKTKSDVTTKAPNERPGVRRTAEMKKLYGKSAAMIHGMETALQMTFDRNCDILQPTLWPIMPFNIQFGQKD
ncbi:gem-associated protein 8-like isoform X2 [Lineus longissimus]